MAALVVTAFLIGGCAGGKASAEGTWGMSGEGQPQLVLANYGKLTGTDGCNRLIGTWKQGDDGSVSFGDVVSTRMFCEGVDTWLSGLSSASVDGSALHVRDKAGTEIGTLTKSATASEPESGTK